MNFSRRSPIKGPTATAARSESSALPLRVAHRLRSILPDTMPLFVRISATDWVDGGWDIDQSVMLGGIPLRPGLI